MGGGATVKMIFGTVVAGRGHQGSSCFCFNSSALSTFCELRTPRPSAEPVLSILPGQDTFTTLKCTIVSVPIYVGELQVSMMSYGARYETRKSSNSE